MTDKKKSDIDRIAEERLNSMFSDESTMLEDAMGLSNLGTPNSNMIIPLHKKKPEIPRKQKQKPKTKAKPKVQNDNRDVNPIYKNDSEGGGPAPYYHISPALRKHLTTTILKNANSLIMLYEELFARMRMIKKGYTIPCIKIQTICDFTGKSKNNLRNQLKRLEDLKLIDRKIYNDPVTGLPKGVTIRLLMDMIPDDLRKEVDEVFRGGNPLGEDSSSGSSGARHSPSPSLLSQSVVPTSRVQVTPCDPHTPRVVHTSNDHHTTCDPHTCDDLHTPNDLHITCGDHTSRDLPTSCVQHTSRDHHTTRDPHTSRDEGSHESCVGTPPGVITRDTARDPSIDDAHAEYLFFQIDTISDIIIHSFYRDRKISLKKTERLKLQLVRILKEHVNEYYYLFTQFWEEWIPRVTKSIKDDEQKPREISYFLNRLQLDVFFKDFESWLFQLYRKERNAHPEEYTRMLQKEHPDLDLQYLKMTECGKFQRILLEMVRKKYPDPYKLYCTYESNLSITATA